MKILSTAFVLALAAAPAFAQSSTTASPGQTPSATTSGQAAPKVDPDAGTRMNKKHRKAGPGTSEGTADAADPSTAKKGQPTTSSHTSPQ